MGPFLSPGIRRVIAGCGVMLYLAIYVQRGRLLPAVVFRDAQKIQDQMHGADTYAGSSFDAVGKMFLTLGPAVDAFVMGIGAWLIWSMVVRANHVGLLVAALMLAAPCVFFNLFVASKDTLVVLMALVIATAARGERAGRGWVPMALAMAMYLAYAATLRAYFALIAGLALAIWVQSRLGGRWQLLIASAIPVVLVCLPPWVFAALQQPRDLAVDYLMFQSPFGSRTSFYNPFPPVSWAAFVGNYGYATVRLNFAVIWSPGVKEAVMQCWVFPAVGPPVARLVRGLRSGSPGQDVAVSLVLAHVAVSMLFEPDLGSFMRHLSSVAALSMLLLAPDGSGRQSVGPPAAQHNTYGPEQDSDVAGERPVLHVADIKQDTPAVVRLAAAADLPEARDAG